MNKILQTTVFTFSLALFTTMGVSAQADEGQDDSINTESSSLIPKALAQFTPKEFSATIAVVTKEDTKVITVNEEKTIKEAIDSTEYAFNSLLSESGDTLKDRPLKINEELILRGPAFKGDTTKIALPIPTEYIETSLLPEGIESLRNEGKRGFALQTTVSNEASSEKEISESFSVVTPPKAKVFYRGSEDANDQCENNTGVPDTVAENIKLVHRTSCLLWPDLSVYGTWRLGPNEQDHATGTAIDIMTNTTEDGSEQGTELALFLEENYKEFGIKYIIWDQQIWSVERMSEGWRDMEDRGNVTQNHFDHVHVSVFGDDSADDF